MFGRPSGDAPQNTKTVEWIIRVEGKGASANLTVVSQKAGTASKKVALETK
jgi:hypothetical protein